MTISIIICTHNRSEYLRIALESLTRQIDNHEEIQLIVVDNKSTDNTQKVVEEINVRTKSRIIYIKENKIGLSNARNRGFMSTSSDWIGYLDDDMYVGDLFVDELMKIINQNIYDVFGGRIVSWFKYGRPKWIPVSFESNSVSAEIGPLREDEIWGGCMFFKRELLIKAGGFPIHLGMNGTKMAYAEETWLIQKFMKMEVCLGFNPNLIVHHLVRKEKLKLLWHLRHIVASERDHISIKQENLKKIYLLNIKDMFIHFPLSIIKSIGKLLIRQEYYFQNAIIDSSRPILKIIGRACIKVRL